MFIFLIVLFLLIIFAAVILDFKRKTKGMSEEEKIEFFRTEAERIELEKIEAATPRCPKCKSIDLDFLGNNSKNFSVGKAVGGAVLTGGVGAIAGFAGKKGNTDRWRCKSCGVVFNFKNK